MEKNNFTSIESIISVAKKGGMFILVDDEKRENEGDLVISTSDSNAKNINCLLYTSPSPRDREKSRMPSSA